MEFLVGKGFTSDSHKEQAALLKRLWFDFYPRNKNTEMTSSGFEHIFLAELKKGKVIGLHNWIYFAEAEKNGELDYKGWMRIIDLGVRTAFFTIKN
jgi:poly(U)-specific endoribonuclease